MKKQSNDGEENADGDKKISPSKSSDGINNADVEMADESKKLEQEFNSVGDDECLDKVADLTEPKATMDIESTSTASISKALLNNIISNNT